MPELPEVESARRVIERSALGREIIGVEGDDAYVRRPLPAGALEDALTGTELASACRRGKTLWCPTGAGPVLGLHLGMSGKIVIADADGTEVDGGDHWEFGRQPGDFRWSRFGLCFADGGAIRLVDPRRLGRVRLDPTLDHLGPDAASIGADDFGSAFARGHTAVKARLLDQAAIAGIGNLLADEILWRAGLHPARPVDGLTPAEIDRLHDTVQATVADALRDGGVHTLPLVAHRTRGGACPRDGTPLTRGTVGGRTTYWCPVHQPERRGQLRRADPASTGGSPAGRPPPTSPSA